MAKYLYIQRENSKKNLKKITGNDLKNNEINLSAKRLSLSFITPTRLKFEGKLTPKLEFHILIRNLLRRISLLTYFHCGFDLKVNFKELIKLSENITIKSNNLSWFDWERYSTRQKSKMKMGGIIGTITYEGVLKEFIPILLLGEYLHVGKGTSFGLGKYVIIKY